MLDGSDRHPDYAKSIKTLEAAQYRLPTTAELSTADLMVALGPTFNATVMVHNGGSVAIVDMKTGQTRDATGVIPVKFAKKI